MLRPDGHILPQRTATEHVRQLWRLSELYHENSKLRAWTGDSGLLPELDPLRQAAAQRTTRRLQEDYGRIQTGAKRYPHMPHLALPPAAPRFAQDLGDVLRQRHSQRHFNGAALALEDLATLLFWSYGITRYADPQQQRSPQRAVPSGGGLYPLEVYLCVWHVDGLAAGIYHYDVYTHSLEQLTLGTPYAALSPLVFAPESLQGAAAVLVLSAKFERVRFKDGEFGYRLIWADTGCVSQTLSLVATALGLGSCLIMGFDEDGLNALLGLNGVDESALLLGVIGLANAACHSLHAALEVVP
jgi:SagB-type dehydrogenase family enzyme